MFSWFKWEKKTQTYSAKQNTDEYLLHFLILVSLCQHISTLDVNILNSQTSVCSDTFMIFLEHLLENILKHVVLVKDNYENVICGF